MLQKTKNNVIGLSSLSATEKVNIDGIREDGTYVVSNETGGGVYPSGWVAPGSIVVSDSGDSQALTDAGSTEFTRVYGLEGWTAWT